MPPPSTSCNDWCLCPDMSYQAQQYRRERITTAATIAEGKHEAARQKVQALMERAVSQHNNTGTGQLRESRGCRCS